jgi:F-type H+-transporting ATPase subunit gamma
MSGLKQLRNRVKSIKSTQKITKAMHVVSAAKLKKIKEQAENFNEYSVVLGDIMNDISTSVNLMDLPANDRKFFNKDLKNMAHLLVVIT